MTMGAMHNAALTLIFVELLGGTTGVGTADGVVELLAGA